MGMLPRVDCTLYVDRLFTRFIGVGQQGKVSSSLTNEIDADKLIPVSEVFRFDSQVGFLTLIGYGQFCISNQLYLIIIKLRNKHAILKILLD